VLRFEMQSFDHLLEEAMQLPSESRIDLVEQILARTPPTPEMIREQMSVVQERIVAVRDGKSKLTSANEAHAWVREALRED